jgi:hypothetical protein
MRSPARAWISSTSILPLTARRTTTYFSRVQAVSNLTLRLEAFEDTWHWGDEAERAFDDVIGGRNTDAAELLRAFRSFLNPAKARVKKIWICSSDRGNSFYRLTPNPRP